MKALSFVDNKIKILDIDEPTRIEEYEVIVEVKYSTFCKDDVRFIDDMDIFTQNGVVGHEAAGVIVKAGRVACANGFCEGVRVMIMPIDICGKCEKCIQQKYNMCNEMKLTLGTMTKYVVRRYTGLFRISDKLTYKQAAILEPVATVVSAINKFKISYDSDVLIIGAGFMGLLFLKIFKMRGVKSVTVVEPIEERKKVALNHGADYVISPNSSNFDIQLLDISDYSGFNIIVETSSNASVLDKMIMNIARNGTILMFSHYGDMKHIKFSLTHMYTSSAQVIWSTVFVAEDLVLADYLIRKLKLDENITAEYSINNSMRAVDEYLGFKQYKIGINNFD
ncbi:MAG: zinc-binding dehydrogenase [Lachnospirales bacterium]